MISRVYNKKNHNAHIFYIITKNQSERTRLKISY